MLALLDRADNDDCVIPAWRAPSLSAAAQDTSLARSTAAAALAHLELHGWLERSGQKSGQMKGTRHSGSGKSGTRWALVPLDYAPGPCKCKPDSPARGPSRSQIVRVEDHPDSPSDQAIPARQTEDYTKGGRDEGGMVWGSPGAGWLVKYEDAG